MAASKHIDRWVSILSGDVANGEAVVQKRMMPWRGPLAHGGMVLRFGAASWVQRMVGRMKGPSPVSRPRRLAVCHSSNASGLLSSDWTPSRRGSVAHWWQQSAPLASSSRRFGHRRAELTTLKSSKAIASRAARRCSPPRGPRAHLCRAKPH